MRGGEPYRRFRHRLRGLESSLRRGLSRLQDDPEVARQWPRAAEWLLDNDYLIQTAFDGVAKALPRGFYGKLPRLEDGPLRGRSRVEGIAREVVAEGDGAIDLERLPARLLAVQLHTTLSIGELWALPSLLRMVALDVVAEALRDLTGGGASAATSGTVADAAQRQGLDHAAGSRSDDVRSDREPPADRESNVISCILSLQALATCDWKHVFESVSAVERVLRGDPADVYPRMDFDSRNRYRSVIEDLSAVAGLPETTVAAEVVGMALEADDADDRLRHIGFYLVGDGRRTLERRLGLRGATRSVRWWVRGHAAACYLVTLAASSAAAVLLLCLYAAGLDATVAQLCFLLTAGALLVSSLVVSFVNFVVTLVARPRVLPKLDFEAHGIPSEFATAVVVPCMLTDRAEVERLLRNLEICYLGSPDPNLDFVLLPDPVDAPRRVMPEDGELVEQVRAGMQELNRRHGANRSPFLLLHRERSWNAAEGTWMAWERKRGKLSAFNRLLAGEQNTGFIVAVGDVAELSRVRFVITLDADTFLPRSSAARMVGAMAHPLNRAVVDPRSALVCAGYTVLQPRVEVSPSSANRTLFARALAGDVGLDLYNRAVSDVYQDLFGEGTYAGKAIYDPLAFEASLRDRIPDNALLSHDLFEGVHGRAGLLSDVVVLEDFPANVLSYMRRLHRWVRGDWQLLPWLGRHVPASDGASLGNSLSALSRWRIFDNLRRSLISPALFFMLLAGWSWLPGSPFAWTLVALAIPALSVFLTALAGARRVALGPSRLPALTGAAWSLRMEVVRRALALVFLPLLTVVSLDAIVRTLYRLTVSHRRLLQWTPAAQAARSLGATPSRGAAWREMAAVPLLTLATVIVVVASGPAATLLAAPFVIAWALSPEVAVRTARGLTARRTPPGAEEAKLLRLLARRTWLFFEHVVGPADHWLAPDHLQEDPAGFLARRTSPTDIGMALLATLAAYDLGYLGVLEVSARLEGSLTHLRRLQRYRGHFLNWYDTSTMEPMEPHYVSTVDSGNLAASLVALRQGCLEIPDQPLLRAADRQGVLDAVCGLDRVLEEIRTPQMEASIEAPRVLLEGLRERVAGLTATEIVAGRLADLRRRRLPEIEEALVGLVESAAATLDAGQVGDLHAGVETFASAVYRVQRHLDLLLPWVDSMRRVPAYYKDEDADNDLGAAWTRLEEHLSTVPTLRGVSALCAAVDIDLAAIEQVLTRDGVAHGDPAGGGDHADVAKRLEEARLWNRGLRAALVKARANAERVILDLEGMAQQADELVDEMNFAFLFDRGRQVFHIGFNLSAGRLDPNYYDLLASEARLASLLAIAKGDVPQSHWMYLGRPCRRVQGRRVLLSWGATMFEYLMPVLLARSPRNTLLGESCDAAVAQQISFGRRHHVPWGISESAYYHLDAQLHYQYRAFGVPPLGLALGIGERLVVAPYASMLALAFRPRAVLENLKQLLDLGMLGRYGLYEAADFGPTAEPGPRHGRIVRSYMIHHQGMVLVAIANRLCGQRMVERFHAAPRVATVEPLIHEQIAREAPVTEWWRKARPALPTTPPEARFEPWSGQLRQPVPQAHLLSNGHFSVLITVAAGGYCWRDRVALTRWHADPTVENWGTWIYLRDQETEDLWSLGYEPIPEGMADYRVQFSLHKAEMRRRSHGVLSLMEVTVAPDDDLEIRRIRIHNERDRPRALLVTSFAEVVLAPRDEDLRHPAFSKLFVESEFDQEAGVLLFRRRPRSATDEQIWLAHAVVVPVEHEASVSVETDRRSFFGRGGSSSAPQALGTGGGGLSGTTGATLDPVLALGCEVEVEPGGGIELAFLTAVGGTRREVLETIQRYRSATPIARAFRIAGMRAESSLAALGATPDDPRLHQQLLSAILFPRRGRLTAAAPGSDRSVRPVLWSFGISGDDPVVVVKVKVGDDLEVLRSVARAQARWRSQRLWVDLVVVDEESGGYAQPLRDRVADALAKAGAVTGKGVWLVAASEIDFRARAALEMAARVVLETGGRSLENQLAELRRTPTRLPRFAPVAGAPLEEIEVPERPPTEELLFDNGIGGFSPDGREYVITLEPGSSLPAPWVNVMANQGFGTIVAESGSATTWAGNSSEHRLTPWHNDPLIDPPGEVLYLRDEETAEIWSATPRPAPAAAVYEIRHGAGYSVFRHRSHGLEHEMTCFVDREEPVKVILLKLTNLWPRHRRLTLTFYAEWVLGGRRDLTAPFVVSEYDSGLGVLLAHNTLDEAPRNSAPYAFVGSSERPHGFTADRSEFLGWRGDLARPFGLRNVGLSNVTGRHLDPCAALQVHVSLAPGATKRVHFLLGEGRSRRHALRLVRRFRAADHPAPALRRVVRRWDRILDRVRVRTPDPAMDLLLNRWLLYQTISCRVWGRAALYQSSGAYGFRDQLQDVMATVSCAPHLARRHLLRAARRQFVEGDVLHWWHPPGAKGVRTRCSDDLLWLPFVTAHYVASTGDEAVLDEQLPFLEGPPLEEGESDHYADFEVSREFDSLYEHCWRAIEKGSTSGRHGMPLIGSGDWNDGMNRVGVEGRGESVWLGWFLCATLENFAGICAGRGDDERSSRLLRRREALVDALRTSAWDGAWYRRAYFDDGSALGSAADSECRIDLIAQAWAVISGAADPERCRRAMEAVDAELVADDGLILLLRPPFDKDPRDPGYIQGYPPGIRENGGQYTHAAVWAAWARAVLGDGSRATALFRMLNPVARVQNAADVARYRVEPYVMAADVYGRPPFVGLGGWTWYTGAAAWMYRLGIEMILGLRIRPEGFQIDPCIPGDWPGFEIDLTFQRSTYRVVVRNPEGVERGVRLITLDGRPLTGTLVCGSGEVATHDVEVIMGHGS